MKINPEKMNALISDIDQVLEVLHQAERTHKQGILAVHKMHRNGARNLVHYTAFRSLDLSKLQKRLSNYGLSILGSSESHILYSLSTCKQILQSLIGQSSTEILHHGPSIKSSRKRQRKHAKDLFGYRSRGRRVRIMVTLPTKVAYNYELMYDLLASGMNTARINCAHDNAEVWTKMIRNLNLAKAELGKNCKVFMDLAGPKIRTGRLKDGPKVRTFRPVRNKNGDVINPAQIELVSELNPTAKNELPVESAWLASLKIGDSITFKDTRNKSRKLLVTRVHENHVVATCRKTSYINEGTKLTTVSALDSTFVGALPALEEPILLKVGHRIRLLKNAVAGEPAALNEHGDIITDAFVSITSDVAFSNVSHNDRCMFNEGKIEGTVKKVTESEIVVEISKAKFKGSRLRADKGVNFPDSNLQLTGLTAKDKKDLKFVVAHADAVNVSFVNSAEDITRLYKELDRLGAEPTMGVILKIETSRAYHNLFEILLAGMHKYPLGVMIARGDLAIETGWEHMARIQQEIILLCNSAHIPTIWATQVLENLAKKGIPSRSELTDVASGLKADCVMLNKGPYIHQAITLLSDILSNMNVYRDKNEKLLQPIEMESKTN